MEKRLFIGNYSKKGIKIIEYDNNKKILKQYPIGNLENTSYICKNKKFLFSVIETTDEKKKSGYVVSYDILEKTVKNIVMSNGESPCFLTMDELRNILYVGNYTSGSIIAFRIEEDGSIGEKLFYREFGLKSNIHYMQLSKDSKKIYVVDLGKDKLYEFSIVYENQKLDLINENVFSFPENTKPRHLAIDNNNNIYVVTEKSCEIYKINYDDKMNFKLIQKASILPKTTEKKEDYTGCAIKIDINNKYMYVSIRGHNSISVFDIQGQKMNQIQNIQCRGICPRDITLDNAQKSLICANQKSNNIAFFEIKNGFLEYKKSMSVEAPSCIVVDEG